MTSYNVTVSLGGGGTSGTFNVVDYGAAKNGSTDDTAAIQSAIDACVAAGGGVVVLPAGEYLITEAIAVEHSSDQRILEISAHGAYVKAASGLADDILRIGSDTARARNVIVSGGRWGLTTRDWSGTTGIRLLNAVNCRVSDTVIWNCEIGIALRGTSSKGCVYNFVSNSVEWDCKYGTHLSCDASNGWVNANTFVGGLTSYSSSLNGTDLSSYAAFAIIPDASWDNDPNSNNVIGKAWEGSSAQTGGYEPLGAYVTGLNNNFELVRAENMASPLFDFDSGANYTRINSNPATGSSVGDLVADADLNRVQVTTNRQISYNGGSATESIMSLYARSSGYRGLDIYESLGSTPTMSLYGGGYMTMAPRAEPGTPDEGMVYYDATANKLKVYNGSAWETITSAV